MGSTDLSITLLLLQFISFAACLFFLFQLACLCALVVTSVPFFCEYIFLSHPSHCFRWLWRFRFGSCRDPALGSGEYQRPHRFSRRTGCDRSRIAIQTIPLAFRLQAAARRYDRYDRLWTRSACTGHTIDPIDRTAITMAIQSAFGCSDCPSQPFGPISEPFRLLEWSYWQLSKRLLASMLT